jgi:hypothetical protein
MTKVAFALWVACFMDNHGGWNIINKQTSAGDLQVTLYTTQANCEVDNNIDPAKQTQLSGDVICVRLDVQNPSPHWSQYSTRLAKGPFPSRQACEADARKFHLAEFSCQQDTWGAAVERAPFTEATY